MKLSKIALTTSALALIAAPAMADTQAQAVTDLNLRAGPGPQFEIINVIDAEGSVNLEGCIAESNWCKVEYNGTEGWAYGDYLTDTVTPEYVSIISKESPVEVTTVTYDNKSDSNSSEAVGAAGGALAGGLIAGPLGAVAGLMVGAATGDAAVPDEKVVTYVRSNATDPIYVEGEVVTGVTIPEEIELKPVPETEYQYIYLNGLPVVVDGDSRQVVYVVR